MSAQGHIESAAGEYRRAIELNPEAYAAHLSLGQILARGGNIVEARSRMAKAAESPDPEVREAARKHFNDSNAGGGTPAFHQDHIAPPSGGGTGLLAA